MTKKQRGFFTLGLLGAAMIVGAMGWGLWILSPVGMKIVLLFVGGFIVFTVGMANAD